MVKEHLLGGQLALLLEIKEEDDDEEEDEDEDDPLLLQSRLQTRGSLAVEIQPVVESTRNWLLASDSPTKKETRPLLPASPSEAETRKMFVPRVTFSRIFRSNDWGVRKVDRGWIEWINGHCHGLPYHKLFIIFESDVIFHYFFRKL